MLLTTHYMDEAERLCDHLAIVDHGRVIARGTPRELIGSLGVEHVVEFSTGGAAQDLDLRAIASLPGVRDVRAANGVVSVQAVELHRAVPALLDALQAQQHPLTQLRTHSATLEDVFVSLTGRHLRDE
jgi:ABC-2 type transport system ATP-binding protein